MAALRNKTAEKQKLCAHLSAGLSNNLHNYLLPDGLAALLVCSQLVAGWTLWASGHSVPVRQNRAGDVADMPVMLRGARVYGRAAELAACQRSGSRSSSWWCGWVLMRASKSRR